MSEKMNTQENTLERENGAGNVKCMTHTVWVNTLNSNQILIQLVYRIGGYIPNGFIGGHN